MFVWAGPKKHADALFVAVVEVTEAQTVKDPPFSGKGRGEAAYLHLMRHA